MGVAMLMASSGCGFGRSCYLPTTCLVQAFKDGHEKRVENTRAQLKQELGREPTDMEVQERMEKDAHERKVRRLERQQMRAEIAAQREETRRSEQDRRDRELARAEANSDDYEGEYEPYEEEDEYEEPEPEPAPAPKRPRRVRSSSSFKETVTRKTLPNCGPLTCTKEQKCSVWHKGTTRCYPGGICEKVKKNEYSCK
jgi:hypothetical protein